MKYILGMDTSCYTTSIALVDLDGNLVYSKQILLKVEEGGRGLQQSKALFQHLQNLPELTSEISEGIDPGSIVGLAASVKPRPLPDSYMPVFMVGSMVGQAFCRLMKIPFFAVSHQENHIMAGQYSAKGPNSPRFIAIHLSGGTSEILLVTSHSGGFDIELLGGTQDLHAGQFVDRIGVAMDLPFPAGPHLEKLALSGREGRVVIPSYVKGLTIGFSGAETHAQRLLSQGASKEDVALAVFNCLIKTLEKWISSAVHDRIEKEILLVGGVSSNRLIREKLPERLHKMDPRIKLYFATPDLSRDNAVGTALLGLKQYKNLLGMER